MRFGDAWVKRNNLSSLRLLGSVGEPINPEAWRWYHKVIGGGRCPVMDTWWQTETGMFMITPMPCTPLKPGSGTKPFPGIKVDIVDEAGKPVKDNEEGFLVIKNPWPAMLRTIWNDPDRYVEQYWSRFPGMYMTGDSARRDEDGYYWIIGRVDDVIKVSGYRLGTAEIESALVSHQAVAEAAAIGLPHEIKGHAIHTFVILKTGYQKSDKLIEELRQHVGHEVGPTAKPEHIEIVDSLPKTRVSEIRSCLLQLLSVHCRTAGRQLREHDVPGLRLANFNARQSHLACLLQEFPQQPAPAQSWLCGRGQDRRSIRHFAARLPC